MKKALLILIPFLFIGCNKYNEETGFYGNVKSVDGKTYETDKKFGEYVKRRGENPISRYSIEFTKEGELKNRIIYDYKNTDIIKNKSIHKYSGGKYLGYTSYNEYEEEEYTKKIIIDNDEIQISEIYKSDTIYSIDTLHIQKKKNERIYKTSTSENIEYYNDNLLVMQTSKIESDDYESDSLYKYEYLDFDNRGNWIRRIVFYNSIDQYSNIKDVYIEEREITYY